MLDEVFQKNLPKKTNMIEDYAEDDCGKNVLGSQQVVNRKMDLVEIWTKKSVERSKPFVVFFERSKRTMNSINI